jgi:hypothetical protein
MPLGAVARLTCLLAAIGLATSRIGLIVHELGGHGGTAVAFGGEITSFRLFWFAGGWIRYDFDDPTRGTLLAISLGGIAVELVIGAALWFAVRKDRLGHRLVRGVGGALVIHAGWYLATGTWHGYGDGVLVHRAVGDWRYSIAIAAGLATCGVAHAVARLVIGALAASIPGSRKTQLVGLAVAAALATGVQTGLALGELAVRGDGTYGAIMSSERDRAVARELAAWQREHGSASAADRAEAERRAAARHPSEPPFLPILAGLLAVAVALGAARARPPTDPLVWRHAAIAGVIAGGAVIAVISLDVVFH